MRIFNRRLHGLTINDIIDCITSESKPYSLDPIELRYHEANSAAYEKVINKVNEINNIALNLDSNAEDQNTKLNVDLNRLGNTVESIEIVENEEIISSNCKIYSFVDKAAERVEIAEDKEIISSNRNLNNIVDKAVETIEIEDDDDTIVVSNIVADKKLYVKDDEYNNNTIKRNEELLRMCKPLKIVLERIPLIRKKEEKHVPECKDNNKEELNNIYNIKKINDLNALNVIIIDAVRTKQIKTKINVTYLQNAIVMFFNTNDDVDGYCLNSAGVVTECLRVPGNKKYNDLICTSNAKNLVKIICCCWFRREEVIQDIMWPKLISHTTAKFFRKPHKCVPNMCKCCCGNKDLGLQSSTSTVDSETKPILSTVEPKIFKDDSPVGLPIKNIAKINYLQTDKEKSCWIKYLLSNNKETNSLINKALSYTRTGSKCTDTTKKRADIVPVHLLYLNKFENKELHCYELSQKGNIVTCIRENFAKSSQCGVLASQKYIKRTLVENACCWHSLEKSVNSLNETLGVTKKSTFIKSSHKCIVGKCSCCCNPTANKTLPTSSKTGSLCPDPQKSPTHAPQTPVTSSQLLVEKTNSSTSCATTTGIQYQKIYPKPTVPVSSVVDSLITTILKRFHDVRLTITSDGKVAAALSTPVTNLSTAELKVLANILSHAQEQVKALGLGPGTNLNQHINLNFLNSININSVVSSPPVSNQPVVNKATSNDMSNPTRPQKTNFTPVDTGNINQTSVSASNKNLYKSFTNLIYKKSISFTNSFKNHLKNSTEPKENSAPLNCTPRIENVFSLQENNNEQLTGSKRKSDENQLSSQPKIRIVSPTKLGVSKQPHLVGNGQVPQINSEPGTSNMDNLLLTNDGDTGIIRLPTTNMLKNMLEHGTNLTQPQFTMIFPQPELLPPTIPATIASNLPTGIINPGGGVYGSNPSSVAFSNIQVLPHLAVLPNGVLSVSQPSVPQVVDTTQQTPVAFDQQCNSDKQTVIDLIDSEHDDDDDDLEIKKPLENMETGEDANDEDFVIKDEFEECEGSILGV